MSKNKEVSTVVNEETLAMLADSYPVEQGQNRIMLPRLGMISQDKTEGKGKAMKVVAEAGEFYIEKPTDEVDEDGKKKWEHVDLGPSIQGIILFQRKQLQMYDENTGSYTSSPVYDSQEEVLPLWCNKAEVAKGTPAELQAMYMYTDKDGKQKSKLEMKRILYVEYDGEVYQMSLRGSSMYSFIGYAKQTLPNSVVTEFSSEPRENGAISWNQMTFSAMRKLTQAEAVSTLVKCNDIKNVIAIEKSQFVQKDTPEVIKAKKEDYDNF